MQCMHRLTVLRILSRLQQYTTIADNRLTCCICGVTIWFGPTIIGAWLIIGVPGKPGLIPNGGGLPAKCAKGIGPAAIPGRGIIVPFGGGCSWAGGPCGVSGTMGG